MATKNLFEGRLTAYVPVEDKEALTKLCKELSALRSKRVSVSAYIGEMVAQAVKEGIEPHAHKQARRQAAAQYDGVPGL